MYIYEQFIAIWAQVYFKGRVLQTKPVSNAFHSLFTTLSRIPPINIPLYSSRLSIASLMPLNSPFNSPRKSQLNKQAIMQANGPFFVHMLRRYFRPILTFPKFKISKLSAVKL